MNTLFMLNCIFWYTTLITLPYMVFGGSCAFRATRNGPWATQECFEEVGLDQGDTVSYTYECQQDSSSMTIMEYGNSFACDGAVTYQATFTHGVHCDDNSNSCNIIEMTENFWYNENNCQGDPDEYNTWYLTEDALNCHDECYTSSSYAYKYRYDEERGLIAYEWEASSGCHGEPLSTVKYLTDCEETGTSSSKLYTFMTVVDASLSKEVEGCDSSNYMYDIGLDVNTFSHDTKENIYSVEKCCSLCNDDTSCLSFSYVPDEFVCYLFQITIHDNLAIPSPGTISSNKCDKEEESEEEQEGCCDSSNYLYDTCHAGHGDGAQYTFVPNIDSVDKCCSTCDETDGCLSFSYIPGDEFGCFLFENVIDNDRIDREECVSANKECDKEEEVGEEVGEEEGEEEGEGCCDSSNYLYDTCHAGHGDGSKYTFVENIESIDECCSVCDETEGCLSFSYIQGDEFGCFLFENVIDNDRIDRDGCVSANKECDEEELECCDSNNYLPDTAHSSSITPLHSIDVGIASVYDCCSLCDATEKCLSFTYHSSSEFIGCYLYDTTIDDAVAMKMVGDISGNIECDNAMEIQV